MLIVSQDKYKVINFNNISVIAINEHDIEGETTDGIVITIGTYKTVKRAKEVLQEIIQAYKDCNYYSLVETGKGFIINDFYQMPEE